jgi:hypothetical protein
MQPKQGSSVSTNAAKNTIAEEVYKDPLDLLDNWPPLGQGQHSETTKRGHEWFRLLAIRVMGLNERVTHLEKELAIKDRQIEDQRKLIDELKDTSSVSKKLDYSSLFKNQRTNDEVVLLAKVNQELAERDTKSKNIVIMGLAGSNGSRGEESEQDKKLVSEVLSSIGLDESRIIRAKRLKKKQPDNSEVNTAASEPILVQLASEEDRDVAIRRAKSLQKVSKFKKVYINLDKTKAEQALEKALRAERNKRNDEFKFEINGRKVGVNNNSGKHYYWGIRANKLVQVEIRQMQASNAAAGMQEAATIARVDEIQEASKE